MNYLKGRESLYYDHNSPSEKKYRNIYSAVLVIALVILIIFFLNLTVFSRIIVDGNSMQYTLQDGDVLYVNELNKTPKHEDIVIIKNVIGKDSWIIKRVIGLEGDIIEFENGKVYRTEPNKERKELSNYEHKTTTSSITRYEIKKGQIFYMGDNREPGGSLDSRILGPCTYDNIVGVVPEWSVWVKGINKSFYNNITVPLQKFMVMIGFAR